jgi:hypothetical protein
MTKSLNDARILDLIEAYGADPAAFPEAERAGAARRLAEAPAVFATALADARRLDSALGLLPEVTVPPALRACLLASAPAPKNVVRGSGASLKRFLPAWLPAGALASLAVGVLVGVNVAAPVSVASVTPAVDEADSVMYAALGFGDYDLMSETTE